MTIEASEAAAFRQRLLLSPGERQDIDYKGSLPFNGDDSFTLKLIRHIQGMANAGGGWLVVGYSQDSGLLTPDPTHTNEICATYEPTRLAQKADSTVEKGQRLAIQVFHELHRDTGLQYPVVQVEGFARSPYVCRSSKDATDTGTRILRQGAVYIRRPGAETAEVSTRSDWEEMIDRCINLRRSEFLTEFKELVDRMGGPPTVSQDTSQLMTEFVRDSRVQAGLEDLP